MAAQNGTLLLVGLESKRTYQIDFYAPDAAGTSLTFNPTGPAASTSPANFRLPENCVLRDIAIAASPTATNFVVQVNGATIVGAVVRWANQLTSLPFRTPMNINFNKGDFISGLQAA